MTPAEIEARALRVIDQLQRGQPTEDARVELKAAFISPEEAARASGTTCSWTS